MDAVNPMGLHPGGQEMRQECAPSQHDNLVHKHPQPLTPYWAEEAITVKQAAAIARVCEGTLRAWAHPRGLGLH